MTFLKRVSLSSLSKLYPSKIQYIIDLDQSLLSREDYWMTQLYTLNPHGLNKMREIRSKNRINYSN